MVKIQYILRATHSPGEDIGLEVSEGSRLLADSGLILVSRGVTQTDIRDIIHVKEWIFEKKGPEYDISCGCGMKLVLDPAWGAYRCPGCFNMISQSEWDDFIRPRFNSDWNCTVILPKRGNTIMVRRK